MVSIDTTFHHFYICLLVKKLSQMIKKPRKARNFKGTNSISFTCVGPTQFTCRFILSPN